MKEGKARDMPSEEAFWERVMEELHESPLDVEVKPHPFYSEPEWDVFELSYLGLGGYRLFSWLSVPQREGPFPGLIQMPDYQSPVDIPSTSLRQHMVVLDPGHRGKRRNDSPFQAHYPGLLTEGIGNSDTYVLRGVYADAVRAVDLLLDQSQVDPGRIAVAGAGIGGTMGLVAAAFRPQVRALAVDMPFMIGPEDALELAGEAYPLGEVNDYLRVHPEERDKVLASLEVFSPLVIAGRVKCPVLLSVGARDRGQCPPPQGEELARRLERGELHRYPGGSDGGGHQHGVLRTRWLREQLGVG